MVLRLICLLSLCCVAFCHVASHAADYEIESPRRLKEMAAKFQPGDVVHLVGTDWRDAKVKLFLTGTEGSPITIRSNVVWRGMSSFEVVGEHVVMQGFVFRDGYLESGHVMKIRGSHCRVTRCVVEKYNPPEIASRYHWLSLYGHHHRVDHCRFEGQNHSGGTLVVWLDGDGEVGRHRIERNHFLNRPRGEGNGFETIRIGTSEHSMKLAACSVSENLFENCDGEVELISSKSCGNVFQANTIIGCAGALTLRHGNHCEITNNLILGDGDERSGGIRVVGEGHQITGNHIQGVGDRVDGAIALSAGVVDAKPNQHAQVRRVLIHSNTLIENQGKEIVWGHGLGSHGRTLMPVEVVISDIKRSGPLQLQRLRARDVGPQAGLPVDEAEAE